MAETHDEVVLVTGFPSFRARKMVEELLGAKKTSLIAAIVHPKLAEQAKAFVAQRDRDEQARILLYEGDAAAIDLGLSGAEYRELAARVHRVHHLAQVTYPSATRKIAEYVNVGATREVIEFGRMCERLRCIAIHSSAEVSGNRTGLVLEDDLAARQTFRSPVEETLARAERLARAAMKDLPITVIRPTQVVGDSRTGEVDRFDGPYLLILLMLNAPQEMPVLLPTRGDVLMNLVPVDYVVRAARHIAESPQAIGKTFHVVDPNPLTVRRVFQLVAQSGGRRLPGGFIPSRVTKALLGAPGVSLLSKSPRAFLDHITTPVRYDSRNADDVLHGSGIECPSFESYVDALVQFVKQRVQERRSKHEEAEVEDPFS
ncbi:MAG TPA: SDR family oxidoreductase [Polyangiaceae bacterium]|nr:SDR family oxidoreductase [Polyangiaceae bacterium]